MLRFPKFWLIFSLAVAGSVQASDRLYTVSGLPDGRFRYWCAADLPGGWVAGNSQGLVLEQRGGWRTLRPPIVGDVLVVAPFAHGIVVAGEKFFYLYSDGKWVSQQIDDRIIAGVGLSGRALLAGRRALYIVDPSGHIVTVRKYKEAAYTRIYRVAAGALVISTEDEPLVWDGNELISVGKSMPWADHSAIASVQELGEGRYFVAGAHGLSIIDGAKRQDVLAQDAQNILSLGLIGAYLFGEKVVVATYTRGVQIYSLSSGTLEWSGNLEETGNVYFAQPHADGLLIGTSNGLYTLPNPGRFEQSSFPPSDFVFAESVGGDITIGLAKGVYSVAGEPLATPFPVVRSFTRLLDGRAVWGGFGQIAIGDKVVAIGSAEVLAVSELPSNRLAVLQPYSLAIFDIDQPAKPETVTPISSVPNSLARDRNGECLVGTAHGVLRIAGSGKVLGHWGEGLMVARQLADQCVLLDQQGGIFDANGAVVAKVPFADIIDIEKWKGEFWLLLRFPDQTEWLGRWDSAPGKWIPQDAPVGQYPQKLRADGKRLYVISGNTILSITDVAPLEAPRLKIYLGREENVPVVLSPARLPSNVDTASVLLPSGRLGPWGNPSYRIELNGRPVERNGLDSLMPAVRVPWGNSTVTAVASWAGLETSDTASIYRLWPWWARWPAWILYFATGAMLLYTATALRTRQLQKRARWLELQVEQRTAELRNAQKAREDFFSTMSHEIRNPLNGVVGICEILAHTANDEDMRRARRHVRTLKGCAEQLRSILDDVLDFSRIDRGQIQINDEDFEVRSAIEGAVRSVDPSMEKTRLVLPTDDVWAHGDVGKIRQIVTNLVSNALKYGVPPAAVVLVTVEEKEPQVALAVAVRNTGPTISAEEIDRIFSGFIRGEDALRRKIPGTGIGLAVSRRMAEAMGGRLDASSRDGLTEFALALELRSGNEPSETGVNGAAVELKSRALAIEDEEYNRTVLGFHLGQLGYQVDWAKDGASAMECVRQVGYDLVLTDFMLPDTTGDALAREMLAVMKDPKPPIIAVTAYSTPDKIALARDAGISGFVTKPVSAKKLRQAILSASSRIPVQSQPQAEPLVDCDFSVFSKINESRKMLAEYAEAVRTDWGRIASGCADGMLGVDLQRAVHSLKGRVLIVHARELAEQLALLEAAVSETRGEDVKRLVVVLRPMVDELTRRARDAAYTKSG